jgi:hypothetical protein
MLTRSQLVNQFNNNLALLQQQGECELIPSLTDDVVSRWISERKFADKPFYSEGEAMSVMMKLWAEENNQVIQAAKKQKTKSKFKKWAESNKKRIEQKEDMLWSRERYQRDLDRMVNKWKIPKEGFVSDEEEQVFRSLLYAQKLRDSFEDDLRQIVKSHRSTRLPLGDEWIWAVERHLFSRSHARQPLFNLAVIMVQMMSLPQIDIRYDRWGEPIGAYLIVGSDTPESVISEYKKDLKELEHSILLTEREYEEHNGQKQLVRELKIELQPKRRERIAHRRDRAKELYQKPSGEIALSSDKRLQQRQKKLMEE